MIYQDRFGNRIETNDATTDPVVCWRQGGGFQMRVPHSEFHERHTMAPEPTWCAGTVTAEWFAVEDDGTDAGKDPTFPCWSNGDAWNGWGMPYFSAETIDELIVALEAVGLIQKVKWVEGKLMVTDPVEDETYEIVPISVPGYAWPLYGLGAGSWTWDAVEFNKET